MPRWRGGDRGVLGPAGPTWLGGGRPGLQPASECCCLPSDTSNIYRVKYQPGEYCLRLSFSRSNDFLLFPSTEINEENVSDYT